MNTGRKRAKPVKTFTVGFAVSVWTEIEIPADTFEEALEKARAVGVKDVVSFDTQFNDGKIEIVQVHDPDTLGWL